MSLTVLPTKTAGSRPPILPPVATTFDGTPGDDSWLDHLRDDVRRVCRQSDAAEPDGIETMLAILAHRERLVTSEIWAYQATDESPIPLPPMRGFPIEYLIEKPSREQRVLQSLLDQLDECRARCERRLARHRFEARLSQDLDTSNP